MLVTMGRNLNPFLGKPRMRGEALTEEEVAKLMESPRLMRVLVDNGSIEVEGMERGEQTGVSAHLKAKVDSLGEKCRKLEVQNADLHKRLLALEGKAAPEKKAKKAAPAVVTEG